MNAPACVYKIVAAADWADAQARGVFEGAPIDRKDGYIHLSTAEQAQETARLHFRGQAGLVAVAIPAAGLGERLKWEPSRGGQLFPHLYGPLDPALAVAVHALPLGEDGTPQLPPLTP